MLLEQENIRGMLHDSEEADVDHVYQPNYNQCWQAMSWFSKSTDTGECDALVFVVKGTTNEYFLVGCL